MDPGLIGVIVLGSLAVFGIGYLTINKTANPSANPDKFVDDNTPGNYTSFPRLQGEGGRRKKNSTKKRK